LALYYEKDCSLHPPQRKKGFTSPSAVKGRAFVEISIVEERVHFTFHSGRTFFFTAPWFTILYPQKQKRGGKKIVFYAMSEVEESVHSVLHSVGKVSQ
jgi:hypothetical protein